jgi:phenylpropionate dioxygenase-like ring-hydroxylating dioxygenase large terminal subunit
MIENRRYVVPESREVGRSPVGFVRMGERMVFWRDDAGEAVCQADGCAHLRCPFQLDMAHLPFVHRSTIGRGNKTVVDGPGILFRDGGFFVYAYSRLDDGTRPRTSAEVPVPKTSSPQKLEFRFPKLWQNYIAEKLRVAARAANRKVAGK